MASDEQISPSRIEHAAIYLLDRIPQSTFDDVYKRLKAGESTWWIAEHLSMGLAVRNQLRQGGFRWSDLALDNAWHDVVEKAARMAVEVAIVSREEALAIVRRKVDEEKARTIEIFFEKPENCRPDYGSNPSDCWFALVSEGRLEFRSSRMICVSKTDGTIIYDGSANDEG